MADILQKIVAAKTAEIAAAKGQRASSELIGLAQKAAAPRDFVGAIRKKHQEGLPAVIAEMKKASPSKGLLRENYQPAAIAQAYQQSGAACLSVLTDSEFFQGKAEDLEAARAACSLPVLRKDFILEEYQVYESRVLGADCILLIAALLSAERLHQLEKTAHALGMAVLVEVHDREELPAAVALSTPLLGINNRNLRDFVTDLEVTFNLVSQIPPTKIVVSESGITSARDVARLRGGDVHTFLVGEAFMRVADPGAALNELLQRG